MAGVLEPTATYPWGLFKMDLCVHPNMRSRAIAMVFIFFVALIPPVDAAEAEHLETVGAVFGGVHVMANSSGNASSILSALPTIVEDYTATWCENCVDVEHAMNDIEDDVSIEQYHFHRFIGESEDPFGTQVGDDRWAARYTDRIPPTAIFNGTIRQIGSVPHGESLEADFIENAEVALELGEGSSTLVWGNGSVSWNLIIDSSVLPENASISTSIWVVEQTASFADGGNGQGEYPHIVRDIISLGDELSGTATITIPDAHDGDDLEIHLIHEIILPITAEEMQTCQGCCGETYEVSSSSPCATPSCAKCQEDEFSLPSIGIVAVISVMMLAAIALQRKQK